MFDNILAKDDITFKELEEITFKIACEIANNWLKQLLELYDKKLMESRDKRIYRNKGKEITSVKTKTGVVEYARTKYIKLNDDGIKKCTYLLDEKLNIKQVGLVSAGVIDLIVENISEVSYRTCAKEITNMTGLSISAIGVWNVVQKIGQRIKEKEDRKVEAYLDDRLKPGTKETPALYQEADGIMIYTQGKDRKEQIEKYKEEHPEIEEVPKKVRNIELRLGMTYEGWKEISHNRYELVGKEYVAGFMTGEKMANITNANLHSKYNMSSVKLRALNSDGAPWIKKLSTPKTIYQSDTYHIKEKINTFVREKEDTNVLKEMFWKKQYCNMIDYVESLKYKYDGEYEEVKKLDELKRYLLKRKDSMKRYNADKNTRNRLKEFSKLTGLKYRNMGCQESNNYSIITRRMKKRRMSWSKNGSENLAKVIACRESESCNNILEDLEIQLLPQSFVEYAEEYIKEIEENIRKMKQEKIKTKAIYTFKQGTLEAYPNIRKLLENKGASELIYR